MSKPDTPEPKSPSPPASSSGVAEGGEARPAQPRDVALITGPTDDGKGVHVLRARSGRLEVGQVRPLEHGKALNGELVSLKPHAEFPALCEVQPVPLQRGAVSAALPKGATSASSGSARGEPAREVAAPRKGPAQVATDRYRANWDAIWSSPKPDEGGWVN